MLERPVVVGKIFGLFGIKGWVKVRSFTSPAENLLDYRPWFLSRPGHDDEPAAEFGVAEGRAHGKGFIARLEGIDDRDAAAGWVGADIQVDRKNFAGAEKGEYYWADLVGLRVTTATGTDLGTVERLLETGAHDVMVVVGKGRHLVPFVPESVVTQVDIEAGCLTVDWDPDY